MERDIRSRIKCRLSGDGKPDYYTVEDALKKLNKLIWKIANSFHMKVKHLDKDDLYQQGCLGVLAAWQKFDETKDIAFITYANWWILKYIQTFCSAMEYSITLNSQNQKTYKALCMSQGATHSIEFEPTNEALASLAKCNNGLSKKLTKDEFSEEDENISRIESESIGKALTNKILNKLKSKLSLKDYYIVVSLSGLVHDEPLSISEISNKLGVDKDYVKYIKSKYHSIMADTIVELQN